jgi:MEDS: MEthanogen/methylotroph, DcmR Sensory domain
MSRPPRTRAVKQGLDHPGGRAGDSALRHTGIRFMGDMPWGTHVCLFYETPQDLLDTAVCYFEAGLKSNEFCVWAVRSDFAAAGGESPASRRSGF